MLKALLVLAMALAPHATPTGPHQDPGRRAGPQREGRQWSWEQNKSRWPRGTSSGNFFFPTKEVEDFLNSMRGDRPGDAIVFPGSSEKHPVFDTDFGYERENGPHTWTRNFPTCGGTRQSPIDIDLDIAKPPPVGAETLTFKHYDALPSQLTVQNSGHSLRMTGNWSTDRRPRVSGFVLPGEYSLAEVHFHWGADDEEGSEHLVQGDRYPLEMHVVNYKTAYGSFNKAVSKTDGLAVITYLFKIQRQINPGLQKLLIASKEVTDPRPPGVSIDPFTLDKIAPPFTRKYASYLGSLTTPPCSEIVRWIVNLHPEFVSSEQLNKLRGLRRSDGTKMLFNFRPVQHLNGREIINVP